VVPVVQGGQSAAALRAAVAGGKPLPHGAVKAPLSATQFVQSYNSTLTAKTGNADLDRAAASLQIHLHSKVERVASLGWLK